VNIDPEILLCSSCDPPQQITQIVSITNKIGARKIEGGGTMFDGLEKGHEATYVGLFALFSRVVNITDTLVRWHAEREYWLDPFWWLA
jgi:hypothetical protein